MTLMRDLIAGKTTLVVPPSAPLTPLTPAGARPDDFPLAEEPPLSPMAQGYLSAVDAVARNPAKRILICGCRPSNIGDERANHPRVELWRSDREPNWRKATIPNDIGVIILLRWLSHPAYRALATQAKARGILILNILSTGDVRQLLDLTLKNAEVAKVTEDVQRKEWERFLATPNGKAYQNGQAADAAAKEVQVEQTVTTQPHPHAHNSHAKGNWKGGQPAGVPRSKTIAGILRRLVRLDAVSPADEADRITPMLPPSLQDVPREKLVKTISNLSYQHRLKQKGKGIQTPATLPQAAKAPTPAVKAPEPVKTPAAVPQAPKAVMSIEDALRAIDTAMVASQQAGEALVQARNAIIATRGSMEQSILKAVQDKMLTALASIGLDTSDNG